MTSKEDQNIACLVCMCVLEYLNVISKIYMVYTEWKLYTYEYMLKDLKESWRLSNMIMEIPQEYWHAGEWKFTDDCTYFWILFVQ